MKVKVSAIIEGEGESTSVNGVVTYIQDDYGEIIDSKVSVYSSSLGDTDEMKDLARKTLKDLGEVVVKNLC